MKTNTPAPQALAKTAPQVESFPFDPNRVTKEELVRLGLTNAQAAGFIRYRGHQTNRFASADDLDPLYIIPDPLKDRLKPLVQIQSLTTVAEDTLTEGAPSTYGSPAYSKPSIAPASIDLNQATAEELQQLKGIGPYWSNRILKYRDALGGFYTVDQIATTYGFPDSTFQKVRVYLNVNSSVRATILINEESVEALAKHPYLNRKQATVIVKYRQQHGPFEGPEDLEKVRILSKQDHSRLIPYINFSSP